MNFIFIAASSNCLIDDAFLMDGDFLSQSHEKHGKVNDQQVSEQQQPATLHEFKSESKFINHFLK